MAIGTAALLAPMAFKAILAGIENRQANEIEKNNPRPEFQIADSRIQALNQARYIASQNNMPGQEQAIGLMNANTSNAAYQMGQAADNPNQIAENISRLSLSNNRVIQDMTREGAVYKRQSQQILGGELDQMANAEQEKYYYDKIKPYEEAQSKAMQLKDAARQNGYDALRTGAELAYMGKTEEQELIKDRTKDLSGFEYGGIDKLKDRTTALGDFKYGG